MSVASDQLLRKKELGQFFTGTRVGTLLAALAGAEDAKRIIDPMVGSGDLLLSCLAVGAEPELIVGVDVDRHALGLAEDALRDLPSVELRLGSAFEVPLPTEQFDLVIMNPPYLRYQARAEGGVGPAVRVRDGLTRAILRREGLPDEYRAALLRATDDYPGTADLAVPSWILAASLVRENGILAVVAPQTWLSRAYARGLRELLGGFFEIEVIVEDGDATWFQEALVRTQLVVARRVAAKPARRPSPGIIARASRELDVLGRLVGRFATEAEVAHALRATESADEVEVTRGLVARRDLGPHLDGPSGAVQVPGYLVRALGEGLVRPRVVTLESYGWTAGQGLRTGANEAFYFTVAREGAQPDERWGIGPLKVPSECLWPVVRRQSDLTQGYSVHAEQLASRVLILNGWVTARDRSRMATPGDVRVLPDDLACWLEQVEATPKTIGGETLFPQLSAVATNQRFSPEGVPVSFWYQLPPLTRRHRPDILVPRVCGGTPVSYLNADGAIVDANFSTLWPKVHGALPVEAVLAVMNSAWVQANLEARSTVLGGGALKIEAVDLRRVALPQLSEPDVSELTRLGRQLVERHNRSALDAIDEVVLRACGATGSVSERIKVFRSLVEQSAQRRAAR